ncbi:methionyl-tRNA formyltransferase [Wenzhouxiangella sp. XN79A]|uniref:methionyl-tRNA formyltransferase n=1 Tax=Wenzhouxiangella sp. XN79A TaxID=2724193 RepID=UPI00144AB39A|nr:methionyl-tRNA formyltransferase [Wenzhouxiangella sp. XN79A]NKI35854.1 methionyl-tRNA formyltransferase [Wenzhouxiangella sp. XN79A]
MSRARLVFAGTPAFAVPALDVALADADVLAVLTQPDRPAGRGRSLRPGPVKQHALAAGVPVLQPERLTGEADRAALLELEPDLLVTAAYGLLLPPTVLDWPREGCWNLHASLLPRWRGASPIQQAIRAGDHRSGISLMQMDPGLDTGPVRLHAAVAIEPEDTAADLHDRLAVLAAEVLREALARRADGTLPAPIAQDETRATHAPRIRKDDARIDWTADAASIARHIHAYNPWPVAFTELVDQPVRIFRARPIELDVGDTAPGQLLTGRGVPDELRVACGRGALSILELQAPGKRRMTASDWLNARPEWRG